MGENTPTHPLSLSQPEDFLLAFLTLLCSACGQCALHFDSLMAGAESITEPSSCVTNRCKQARMQVSSVSSNAKLIVLAYSSPICSKLASGLDSAVNAEHGYINTNAITFNLNSASTFTSSSRMDTQTISL